MKPRVIVRSQYLPKAARADVIVALQFDTAKSADSKRLAGLRER